MRSDRTQVKLMVFQRFHGMNKSSTSSTDLTISDQVQAKTSNSNTKWLFAVNSLRCITTERGPVMRWHLLPTLISQLCLGTVTTTTWFPFADPLYNSRHMWFISEIDIFRWLWWTTTIHQKHLVIQESLSEKYKQHYAQNFKLYDFHL